MWDWSCVDSAGGRGKPFFARDFGRSGAEESRTPDLIIANDALYQLSYRPERTELCCRRWMAGAIVPGGGVCFSGGWWVRDGAWVVWRVDGGYY